MGAKLDKPGLIYYLLDASRLEQRLKIGYTANLNQRIAALTPQTLSRQIPLVLALEEGDSYREKERHEQFDKYRVMGEWFRYEGELFEHVRELPNPIGWLNDHPKLWRFAGGWQSFTGWQRIFDDREYDQDDYYDDGTPKPVPVEF
jgi:hypothetical protein